MADDDGNPLLLEAIIIVSGLALSVVARRVVNVVWVAATGRNVPEDPSDPKVSTGEAVVFAAATGALLGLARLLVQRKAKQISARRRARDQAPAELTA